METCLTYSEFATFIDSFWPVFFGLTVLAVYGLFSFGIAVFSYIDRVRYGHVEPCPCSLKTQADDSASVTSSRGLK